ncbi:MAG: hypothetical protein AB8F26_03740 [Phycisphaerales bacterium]
MAAFSIRSTALALIAGGLIGFTANTSIADEVVLRDGTVYTGTVVSQTRRQIIIDTEVHGIRTRLTIDRREVKSVIRGDTPSSKPEVENTNSTPSILNNNGKDEESSEPEIMKRDGYDLIMEIPMNGTFGQDIYPLSIKNTLEWGAERGVTDVVFRMNSGGGEVWAAMEIVEIMAQHADQFRYHALIEHAISATIWPAFNCNTITMAPGGTFGGAVAYRMNGTGSAEVDKKMNSIWSAKLAASAEANGHSPYLVHAMIVSDNAVYATRRGGEWVLTDEIPSNGEYETIDSPDTVLTLTADQAAKYGIVTAIDDRSMDAFTEVQGIIDWDSAGEEPNEIAEDANAICKKLRKELMGSIGSFYREQGVWAARSSIRGSASALQNMRRQLGRYKAQLKKAERLSMDAITGSFEEVIDVDYWEIEIETRMQEIRNTRRP